MGNVGNRCRWIGFRFTYSESDYSMTDNHEQTQNQRLRDLEKRMTNFEASVAGLISKIDTLTGVGKAVALLAGAAIGIDVIPMM